MSVLGQATHTHTRPLEPGGLHTRKGHIDADRAAVLGRKARRLTMSTPLKAQRIRNGPL